MNSNAICPISSKKIDENVARFNGGLTVVLLAVFLLTQNIIPIIFLLVDFFLRSAELSAYSPLANLSKYLIQTLGIKKNPINAGPKIFASRIGVIFSSSILISNVIGFETASYVFTAIFGFCAFLESVFGYCVACQIYPFVFRLTYKAKNAL
jgi:hypothetical protein